MAIILCIDTIGEAGSIALAENGREIGFLENNDKNTHASWLQSAIQDLLHSSGFTINRLQAVAVSSGPGSYTGLRVGMASAKGLCYALGIPLIEENSLKVMTMGLHQQYKSFDLYCPMVDARRMEVFMAMYNNDLEEIMPPLAKILDEQSFIDKLEDNKMIFFGSGSVKLKKILNHKNAFFSERMHSARELITIAEHKYLNKEFADLAYSVPFYVKEFYDTRKK